ncbi:HAD family hydrolase [Rhizomonospora bruguierae]|uniref:HAD family hydrolase n=1 Tax=Rhizomonospora bruguierae TaxID=1581705 RepID=UPI001BCF49BC|nr:HAD family phosphatase [Micromonospora sp. NBRC 107566]
MIEAVVFDLDGVIVDSEVIWERIRRRYVAERAGHWPADAQHRLMGMSTPEWAAYLASDFGIDEEPGEVARGVIGAMAEEYHRHLPLIPGAVEAVRRIAAGWPIGVASSSPPRLIEAVLDATGLAGLMRGWASSEEVPAGKPAPDVYLAAAGRIGVDAAGCAAVEDSGNGLLSAAAAGMAVIAVPRPEYPPAESALAVASAVLDDIGALTATVISELRR